MKKLLLLSAFLLFTVALPANAATYFQDTFTEPTSDTDLGSHTPDIGTSWIEVIDVGTCGIRANAASDWAEEDTTCTLSQGSLYTANATYTEADYYAEV